eukprot:SAG22_NODE_820_length_7011_cov_2.073640_2_plen_107_part_00
MHLSQSIRGSAPYRGWGSPDVHGERHCRHREALQALEDVGADLEAQEQVAPRAHQSWRQSTMGTLVACAWGADTATADSEGNTALHHAAEWGKLDCAQLLLDGGAD